MKLSVDLGCWARTKSALAVAAALAIGGAFGSALAIGPTVPAPVKWSGGWEANRHNVTFGATGVNVYTVPAGRNLLVTDIILGNEETSLGRFHLFVGPPNCDIASSIRLRSIIVQPQGSTVIPFTTGVGFTSGQTVCIEAERSILQVNMRGFLFTPAPTG